MEPGEQDNVDMAPVDLVEAVHSLPEEAVDDTLIHWACRHTHSEPAVLVKRVEVVAPFDLHSSF